MTAVFFFLLHCNDIHINMQDDLKLHDIVPFVHVDSQKDILHKRRNIIKGMDIMIHLFHIFQPLFWVWFTGRKVRKILNTSCKCIVILREENIIHVCRKSSSCFSYWMSNALDSASLFACSITPLSIMLEIRAGSNPMI